MLSSNLPNILDFNKYINKSVTNFIGREWTFQIINNWINSSEPKRFLVLTGEPGSGKTALAARLVEYSKGSISSTNSFPFISNSFLKAIHFCSARDRHWINPRVFTESLTAQFALNVPGFLQALMKRSGDRQINLKVDVSVGTGSAIGIIIEKLNLGEVSPEDAFTRFIREPLEEVIRGGLDEQIIVLVDGLDEANQYTGEVNINNLLTETEHLPSNVRFIVTTRSSPDVMRALRYSGMELHSLTSDSGLFYSLNDIKEFVLQQVNKNIQLKSLLEKDFSADAFASIMQGKSLGNFLYATLLLKTLEDEKEIITIKSLGKYPVGLDDFYLRYLDRLKKNVKFRKVYCQF